MYLQSWDKHFSGATHGGDSVFSPVVKLTAILGCPCCKSSQPVEGAGYQIGQMGVDGTPAAARLTRSIEWGLQELSKQRSCENCGVISVMPPADVKRLKQQMEETVTLAWVAVEERRTVKEQKQKKMA